MFNPSRSHFVARWPQMVATVAYAPFLFLGYGTDVDSYLVIGTARHLRQTLEYLPSRYPGYPVHEFSVLALDALGGAVLANAGSLVMAIVCLVCFRRLCEHFHIEPRAANLLVLAMALHPSFWLSATTTIDYVWALALLLSGLVVMLERRRFVLGSILWWLAIGTRLPTVLACGTLYGYCLWTMPDDRKAILRSAVIPFAGGLLWYVPSYFAAGQSLAFLEPNMVDDKYWSLPMHVGRFGYKHLVFWGVPAFVLLVALAVRVGVRCRDLVHRESSMHACVLALAMIGIHELLFLKFPIEPEYLLPVIPFVLLIAGLVWGQRRVLLTALVVLVFSANIVSISFARPNVPTKATSAAFGVWIEPGRLIRSGMQRWTLRHCRDYACWHATSNNGTFLPEKKGSTVLQDGHD